MIGEQAGRALSLLSGIVACKPPGSEAEDFWPGMMTRIVVDLDEAGSEEAVSLVAGLLADIWDRLVPVMTPVREYELASARLDRATARLTATRREGELYAIAAEAEYTAARHDLERFEVSPGIPKPEYDPLRTGPDGFPVVDKRPS